MAISSYKTFLMKKGTGDTYEKLIDIKNFPNLGGTPELLQTTTLSDRMHTYIPGIQTLDSFEFRANYTKENFASVKALEGVEGDYAVWFGGTESSDGLVVTPTGEHGKFPFKGQLSVYVVGADVNQVVDMGVTVTPASVIGFETE